MAMRARNERRPSPQRIKLTVSYEVAEIAKLVGIHRNTVRRWIKEGLRPIDDRRPALIHGSVLKAFLTARRISRRRPCAPGEFYCFRCRTPRAPWGGTADVLPHTQRLVRLQALCGCCETAMHRVMRCADVPKLAALIELHTMDRERLSDRSARIANSVFAET